MQRTSERVSACMPVLPSTDRVERPPELPSAMIAGTVKLKKDDGQIVSLSLDELSPDDQAWIKKRGR